MIFFFFLEAPKGLQAIFAKNPCWRTERERERGRENLRDAKITRCYRPRLRYTIQRDFFLLTFTHPFSFSFFFPPQSGLYHFILSLDHSFSRLHNFFLSFFLSFFSFSFFSIINNHPQLIKDSSYFNK